MSSRCRWGSRVFVAAWSARAASLRLLRCSGLSIGPAAAGAEGAWAGAAGVGGGAGGAAAGAGGWARGVADRPARAGVGPGEPGPPRVLEPQHRRRVPVAGRAVVPLHAALEA